MFFSLLICLSPHCRSYSVFTVPCKASAAKTICEFFSNHRCFQFAQLWNRLQRRSKRAVDVFTSRNFSINGRKLTALDGFRVYLALDIVLFAPGLESVTGIERCWERNRLYLINLEHPICCGKGYHCSLYELILIWYIEKPRIYPSFSHFSGKVKYIWEESYNSLISRSLEKHYTHLLNQDSFVCFPDPLKHFPHTIRLSSKHSLSINASWEEILSKTFLWVKRGPCTPKTKILNISLWLPLASKFQRLSKRWVEKTKHHDAINLFIFKAPF